MKSENKRMAKERRAKERKRQERNAKLLTIGKWMLVIAVIAGICGLIWLGVQNIRSTPDTGADTVTEKTEDQIQYRLNTEPDAVIKDGDKINLDYVGMVDGVEFTGGSTEGQGAELEIGSGTYIQGFEEQIIGHKVGETFDISVTFPEGYPSTTTVNGDELEMSGADAVFRCTVNGIYEQEK